MVISCVAAGCTNRQKKNPAVSFHRFPSDAERCAKWINAVDRKNWTPSEYSYLCGKHFVNGAPSKIPTHPDWVPSIFSHNLNNRSRSALRRYERTAHRNQRSGSQQIGASSMQNISIPECVDATGQICRLKLHPEEVYKERKGNRDIQNADNTDQKIAHGNHLDDHNYCIPVDKRSPQKLKINLLQQTDKNEATRKPNRHYRRKKIYRLEEVISELEISSHDESQEGSEPSNDDLKNKEKNQTLTDEFDPLLPSVQMLPKNLCLKKSGSNEKEYGVWSSTEIAKGVIYGPYNGIYLDDDDGELDKNDYCLKELKDNDIVYFMNNKNNEQADWFQYVNFAYHHEEQNLVVLKCGGHIYYETIKDILPDLELLVQFSHKRESRSDDHTSKITEEADVSKDSDDEAKVVKKPRGRPRKHVSKRVDTGCNTDLTKRDKSSKSYNKREKISSGRRKKCVDDEDFNKTITRSKNCGDEAKISPLRTRKRLDDTDLTKTTPRLRNYCDIEKNSPVIIKKSPAEQAYQLMLVGLQFPKVNGKNISRVAKSDHCAAINCNNNRGNCNLSIFNFPKDPERCKQWIINTRREDLLRKGEFYTSKNCHLCSNHFEDSQFMNANRNKLIWNAVPTRFEVPNSPKLLEVESGRTVRPQKRKIKLDHAANAKRKKGTEYPVDDTELIERIMPKVKNCQIKPLRGRKRSLKKDPSKSPVDNTKLTKITPKVKTFRDIKKISPVRAKRRSTKKDIRHPKEKNSIGRRNNNKEKLS